MQLVPEAYSYRGRRRRRPRRQRSSLRSYSFGEENKLFEESDDGGREEGLGAAVIDLASCREVVRGELGRLDRDLERQVARLSRKTRR